MSLMERFRPAGRLQQYGQGSRRLGGWEEDGGNRAWCTTKPLHVYQDVRQEKLSWRMNLGSGTLDSDY